MKKMLLTLLMAALLMMNAALAENVTVIPVEALHYEADELDESVTRLVTVDDPARQVQRWNRVLLSDGREGWVCTVFDLAAETRARSYLLDGTAILMTDVTDTGYFTQVQTRWEQVLGRPFALWTLNEKLLFHQLYALTPCYSVPQAGDIDAQDALNIALSALRMDDASAYQVGYGYLAGEAGVSNGIWEVYLVKGTQTVQKVNLDAVTGAVLYIEPDEEGNG